MFSHRDEEKHMYGSPGFTETVEVRALLAPYESADERDDEFCRFSGLTVRESEQLLRLLPEMHARNRQNAAPSFEEFVELGQDFPALRFHGYRIGACRPDERITMEGYFHPPGQQAEALYDRILQIAGAPDEYDRWGFDGERVMRAWWD